MILTGVVRLRISIRKIRKTYGETAVSESNVRRWFLRFKGDERTLKDLPREVRPKAIDNEALRKAVDENPFLTIRELAEMFECGPTTLYDHMKAIGKVNKRGTGRVNK